MTTILIAITVIILISIALAYYLLTRDTHLVRIKHNGQVLEFGQAMRLVGMPVVTFYQGDKEYHFILDSGSNVTYIDQNSDIQTEDLGLDHSYTSTNGIDQAARLVLLKLYYNDHEYICDKAHRVDLSGLNSSMKDHIKVPITGLIGGDLLSKYNYCLDYKEYKAYERK